ncbi:MAG: DUF1571 domain-containing protein [Gammaproteobacteria bacterium]|nr:DUF1571 domain-containing protein [Gammaproteobacteria bacterium]
MLGGSLLALLILADTIDPLQTAIDHYQGVAAYQVVVTSTRGDRSETLRYYFRKPGQVRIEFVQPFRGAVLIYDPATQRARLWPFGYRTFPALTLRPGSPLIRSATGQRIDRSDVGALYDNMQRLQQHGSTAVSRSEVIAGKDTLQLSVDGEQGFSVGAVHRYQLWLDPQSGFPVKVISHDVAGRLIEVVELNELQINPVFPDGFFNP